MPYFLCVHMPVKAGFGTSKLFWPCIRLVFVLHEYVEAKQLQGLWGLSFKCFEHFLSSWWDYKFPEEGRDRVFFLQLSLHQSCAHSQAAEHIGIESVSGFSFTPINCRYKDQSQGYHKASSPPPLLLAIECFLFALVSSRAGTVCCQPFNFMCLA